MEAKIAKLNEKQLEDIKNLENELGVTLIAYAKNS